MIISGANNLYNNRKTVDELNVFPVPDGDTGTNMSLTATAMATELLKKGDRSLTGPTVPQQGLYITRVWYDGSVGEMMS